MSVSPDQPDCARQPVVPHYEIRPDHFAGIGWRHIEAVLTQFALWYANPQNACL
jgi:hypothetical protein